MNLHLLWDEKITPRIIKTFEEVFPGENKYVFWYNKFNKQHFVREDYNCYVIRGDKNYPSIDYSRISKVIIHGLDIKKINYVIKYLPKNIPVFWILWGAELYNQVLSKRGYELYYKNQPPLSLRAKIRRLIERFGIYSYSEIKFFKLFNQRRVTMVCAPNEFELIRKYYPKETLTLLNEPNYFYYPIDEILGDKLKNAKAEGDIILVGNSASWTNNHEYVFDYLKNLDIKGKKIVTPLSYGGNDNYINNIVSKGHLYFEDSFKPLLKFLPLEEYNALMANSVVCIYGSWRQEAMGNIVIALYLGSKVFLSERNPLYEEFKRKGLVVFKLEDIDQKSLDATLDSEEKRINREILSESNNWERLKQLTYNIFK